MQQMTFMPEPTQEAPIHRPGRDELKARLAERSEPVTPDSSPDEEPEDPETILRALITDLEEAIEIGRQMDDDLMTMMRRIVPAEEATA